MATYAELFNLRSDSALRNKIAVACCVASEAIRVEDSGTANHAGRLTWARGVFADPNRESERMLMAVLAQNRTFTVAEITGAADADIQTAVNNAVNVFVV
jgi:hypothetical protein